MRLAALFLALGFTVRHVHDSDGLLYRVLGRRIAETGEWWHLALSPGALDPFTDHLAPAFWWVAIAYEIGGDHAITVGALAIAIAAACVWAKVLTRFSLGHAVPAMLLLWACTESWMRVVGEPRLEMPYVLLQGLAVLCATHGTRRHIFLAGVLSGIAVVFRGPVALALLPIVWLASSAKRDVWLQVLGFCAPLVVLYLCADHAGALPYVKRYWDGQVMASLTGGRTDGDVSHFGAVRGVAMTCWPALALIPLLAIPRLRGERLGFFWAIVLIYLGGLSLGVRHVPNHMWPAYPALFTLAAVPLTHLLSYVPPIRFLPWLAAPAAIVLALTGTRCKLQALDRTQVCNPVHIDTGKGDMPWQEIETVAHHLRRDVTFDAAQVGKGPGCESLTIPAGVR